MGKYVSKELGLSTMGGLDSIYNKIVSAFVENNQHLISDISSALVGYSKEAHRLVHSIKGIAKNIGSEQLSEVSTNFENAILEKNKDEITKQFGEFKEVFQGVMNELEDYLNKL